KKIFKNNCNLIIFLLLLVKIFKHKKERYWEVTKQEIQKLDTNFLGHPKPLFSLSMVELWERFAFHGNNHKQRWTWNKH
ncbi:hypothetical protein OLP48_01625, partial [Campylobacter jejuni]|nr:hypothetical protein [Campylobacter jejuni]